MSGTVRAANGLVATGHPLATAAGLAALRDGGSATDAAVAAAAVSAVVLPDSTSAAGDMFALVYDARTQKVTAFNGSGRAPRSMDRERFRGTFPEQGAVVSTVPGAVAGWADLLAAHGRFSLARALHSAIEYAADGFPVSNGIARAIAEAAPRLAVDEGCARTFLPRGRALGPGEILQQPELAETLRTVAHEGADSFYRGSLAERIAAGVRRIGGEISLDDLAAHTTDRPEPLEITYRGLKVYGQPPVSQGHILLEELAMAEGYDLKGLGWGSAELVHLMVEMKKMAFADRDHYAGDPHAVSFDARRLLEPAFIAARRSALSDKATDGGAPGALLGHTTYICAVDRDGNAVSFIESIFQLFGARAMVPGTGLLLNSRLTGFSLDAGSPNVLAPGKRPVHTLNAVMALENGIPRHVWGTPGAQAQVQTNFQLGVGLIDFGFEPQRAIEEPRWRHTVGKALELEGRFPEGLRSKLAAKGHKIQMLPDWDAGTGGAQIISIEPNGSFAGGADPRRDGHAAGY